MAKVRWFCTVKGRPKSTFQVEKSGIWTSLVCVWMVVSNATPFLCAAITELESSFWQRLEVGSEPLGVFWMIFSASSGNIIRCDVVPELEWSPVGKGLLASRAFCLEE